MVGENEGPAREPEKPPWAGLVLLVSISDLRQPLIPFLGEDIPHLSLLLGHRSYLPSCCYSSSYLPTKMPAYLYIFFLYIGLWLGLVWLRADFHRMSCGRSCGRDVGQKSKGHEKRRKREDERDFQVLACLAHPLWLRCPFPLPPRFFGMIDGFVADAVLDDVWTVRRMSHGKSTEEITGPGRR